MTDTIDQETLKSFLFYELSEEERLTLEERFFVDNDLFYDLMELENELVDRYVSNDLSDKDRLRFEKSLASSPERHEKIANAKALKSFIAEETQEVNATVIQRETVEETPTFWQKFADFFTFKMPVIQYATAALILILAAGMGFLIYDRIRLSNEMAQFENEQQQQLREMEQQEKLLQEKLKQMEEREKDLQDQQQESNGQINNTNKKSDQIDKEKQQTEKQLKDLKDESEKLKKNKTLPPVRKKDLPQPPKPTLATITLLPLTGAKGGGGEIKEVERNASTVVATLKIPADSTSETFTATFKGATLAKDVKPKDNTITVRIITKNLTPGEDNLITITDNEGKKSRYVFRLKK